ncbi:hypothetical protein ACXJJ3_37910 [Kribbella sp. WER1]
MNTTYTARATLATLPVSIPRPADVSLVDGASDWPAEVRRALRSGSTAVVVVHPRIAEFADLLSAPVLVDSPWASNPVIDSAAQAFRVAEGNRMECRVLTPPGSDLTTALLHELALVRALRNPVRRLTVLHLSGHVLYAQGSTDDGVHVGLSVVRTAAVPASANVQMPTPDGSVELWIPAGDTARPARLTVVSPDGAVLTPTVYETGHRATLRRLHDTAPADRLTDLNHLYDDVQVASAALAATEGALS